MDPQESPHDKRPLLEVEVEEEEEDLQEKLPIDSASFTETLHTEQKVSTK